MLHVLLIHGLAHSGTTIVGKTLKEAHKALTRPLSDGAVPTAERLSGSNASAAPCFCHNQETALCNN